MMFGNNKFSGDVTYLIAKNSVGAEIGVWKGNSSKKFLARNPKELHLVDPWSTVAYVDVGEEGAYQKYLDRYATITGGNTEKDFAAFYENVYQSVKSQFAKDPRVTIHRMTADDWFESFEGELDWVYVDGDHSSEGCYRDLCNALKVVKSGGYILGDDYMWAFQKYGKKGVTQAVDKFQSDYNLKVNQEGAGSQFSIQVP